MGHSWRMCWALCCSAPHGQAEEGRRPQRCMLALKRPTPVLRRLSVDQFLRERSAPGGRLVFGEIVSWAGRGVCCQLVLQACSELKLEPLSDAEWRENGRRDGRR